MASSAKYCEGTSSNQLDGIVWELELPAWRFTFVSQQAERILGYPITQWEDPNFWPDHLYPDDRSWAVDFCMTATDKGENHQFEYRMIASDGRIACVGLYQQTCHQPQSRGSSGMPLDGALIFLLRTEL